MNYNKMVKTNTRSRLLKYIQNEAPVRVKDIVQEFGLSAEMVHRHLKKLLNENLIIKKGKAPRVFYFPATNLQISRDFVDKTNLLKDNWLTVLPNGNVLLGATGFNYWCEQRGLSAEKKVLEYQKIYLQYEKFREKSDQISYINATDKFRELYDDKALAKVFYLDFFSYPVFGRTKWGQFVLYAKLNEIPFYSGKCPYVSS